MVGGRRIRNHESSTLQGMGGSFDLGGRGDRIELAGHRGGAHRGACFGHELRRCAADRWAVAQFNPSLSFSPGFEVSGVIAEVVGDKVEEGRAWRPGNGRAAVRWLRPESSDCFDKCIADPARNGFLGCCRVSLSVRYHPSRAHPQGMIGSRRCTFGAWRCWKRRACRCRSAASTWVLLLSALAVARRVLGSLRSAEPTIRDYEQEDIRDRAEGN